MKRINYLASFLFAAFILSSCGGLDKMKEEASDLQYNVTPKVLEVHANMVKYEITGDIPAEWFNKKAIVEFTPVFEYDGGKEVLESKTYQGESVEANNKVIPYETGGSVEFSGEFEYNEAMRVGELKMTAVATIKDNNLELPALKLADGIISTPLLVQVNPKPILASDKFERVITEKQIADIHYVIQRSNIRNSELTAEDIKELEKFIKEANEKENKDFKGIEISAYASPDGPEKLNERLSVERKKSADNYLAKVIDKAKVKDKDAAALYNMKSTAEDWEGFKKLVETSTIEDKDLILRVLSMYSDPAVREKEIKNMSATFEVLAEDILPKLRRSEIAVNIEKTGFSDEQILDFAVNNPDTLNLEELLYAAKLTEDLEGKVNIYKTTIAKHEGCFRAHNNLGFVYIKQGNLADAKAALEKANELKEGNPIVNNNLGVVALKEGDKESAEKYFLSATDAGTAVDYNLGIIKIMDGEYEAAINYFQDHKSFNTALAMLLAGKNDSALKTIDAVEEDNAMNDYLKAVIAARIGDEGTVLNSLKTAIEKDPELIELAKTDLEFRTYFENEVFKSMIQ
ncbi:MAG: tetratricopeptide repeat protein [Bacteroidales bacterium]|jgi:tetratricopeptide (TPR) repeat protein|nr:tetratricopeptide repeat protein [Bacteroidales bacterium]